jgi:hypothetical protein
MVLVAFGSGSSLSFIVFTSRALVDCNGFRRGWWGMHLLTLQQGMLEIGNDIFRLHICLSSALRNALNLCMLYFLPLRLKHLTFTDTSILLHVDSTWILI